MPVISGEIENTTGMHQRNSQDALICIRMHRQVHPICISQSVSNGNRDSLTGFVVALGVSGTSRLVVLLPSKKSSL